MKLKKERNTTMHFFSMLLLLGIHMINAQQMTIAVSGNNWAPAIPAITEAGNNYSGTYESAANQILLSVSVPLLLGSGKVSVHYEANPTWNNSLILRTRRTGDGTTTCVLCTISGGTTYQNITLTSTELFRVQAVLSLASYSNIPIQLELAGVSVTIPAATYQGRVVFTIGAL
ncbi:MULTISPECIES: hypothetical protein [Chryseobacterium]|uniref:DUF4402 domain-containing protein n=1 Tax=Chryseobacterium camelliae TaxID=1265445 RepID=A0ABU0TLG1_9FLAO|nr:MULTISPECIES: hypothetical protein [Chryseobacterium]MDT3408258.1 hypothetical protein [Pseudacidovorax intermedius]MDQ1097887.1 hypothetical protein [Chryseobacterium camelliae]MDQ1101821.1 hypothetical protein [Chryseobacterium sp. SORGH_AS_1048]MDR6085259.1 hypothetical protein [Chryseobacterium sp. SORGH_AS_0909]MDR6129618.1 hypothetical protein [Chryseobacterium sp. SORGH_AS_1175]